MTVSCKKRLFYIEYDTGPITMVNKYLLQP